MEVQINPSVKVEEDDSEVKSIVCLLEILQQQNLKFCSMFIRLLQEEFTHQVKVHQLSVLQPTFQKILKQEKMFLNQEHLYFQIKESVVLMSLIKWMRTQESFYMKLWSNKLFQSLKLELFVL